MHVPVDTCIGSLVLMLNDEVRVQIVSAAKAISDTASDAAAPSTPENWQADNENDRPGWQHAPISEAILT